MHAKRALLCLFVTAFLAGGMDRAPGAEATQVELEAVKREAAALRREVERLEAELRESRREAAALSAALDEQKRADQAMAAAGQQLDGGDLAGALHAFRAYLRDFPSSPHAPMAASRVERIEQHLAARSGQAGREVLRQEDAGVAEQARRERRDAAASAQAEHEARVEQARRDMHVAAWQKYDSDMVVYNRQMQGYERSRRSGRRAARPSPPRQPSFARPPDGEYPDHPTLRDR